jgi:ElaB/YqjD/DUF883 family membrane-anchored ribosome-binding protein
MTSTDFTGNPPGGRQDRVGEGSSPKDIAKGAIQTVKDEAASFADTAKDKALEQVDQGKETASKTMGDFAAAIRKAGDELAQHDQTMAGQMVKKAADGLETLSRSVSDKRPEEMLDAVRDFARDNPAAFIAGSVLVGLAIGRFARSSERHEERQTGARASDFGEERSFAPISAYPMPGDGQIDREGFDRPDTDGGSFASQGFGAPSRDPEA